MIRKIIFTFSFLCLSALSIKGQCVGDTSLKSPGFKPATLPNAKVWDGYDQAISVLTPRDTKVLISQVLLSIKIDSIKATGVYGLPPGFEYTCTNPNCIFVWNETRCVRFYGTTSQAGVYPLVIPLISYAKLGASPISRPDTLKNYSLIVDAGTGISWLKPEEDQLQIFPNPSTDHVLLYHPALGNQPQVSVFDVQGRKIYANYKFENGLVRISLKDLDPGIYLVSAAGKTVKLCVNPGQ
jgi:hypothetical protein